jgi:hypothetical protein
MSSYTGLCKAEPALSDHLDCPPLEESCEASGEIPPPSAPEGLAGSRARREEFAERWVRLLDDEYRSRILRFAAPPDGRSSIKKGRNDAF